MTAAPTPTDMISGASYAAGPRAIYSGCVDGIGNIALMTSCIFGVDVTLGKVLGPTRPRV